MSEKHQVLPADGYTRLFENLVDSCGERLTVQLNTDYREVVWNVKHRHLIFTGPIDAYFDHRFGPLPYRTLRFDREYHPPASLPGNPYLDIPEGFIQPAVQVNYPGSEPWTRCVEAKHITRQRVAGSTLVREFPETYEIGKEPYYPIPFRESREIHHRYKAEADNLDQVTFLGRLGTYAYINMDQCVDMALRCVEKLIGGR